MNTIPLFSTLEILGAMETKSLSTEQKAHFKKDAKSFLLAEVNIALDDATSVHVVDNSADEVNLVLPYYEALQHQVETLSDDDLDEVAGGEFVGVAVVLGIVLAAGTTAAIIAGTVTKVKRDQREAEARNERRQKVGLPPIEGK